MDEKEYWQREYQITMLAVVGQHSDRVKVLAAESLFTLYQFRYAIQIKDLTLPIFEYLKCFKN